MSEVVRRRTVPFQVWKGILVAVALLAAAYLGSDPSRRWLGLIAAATGAAVLLRRPVLGLYALAAAALIVPLEIGTGTEVSLNAATLIVPVLLGLWLLLMARDPRLHPVPSPVNAPLLSRVAASHCFIAMETIDTCDVGT